MLLAIGVAWQQAAAPHVLKQRLALKHMLVHITARAVLTNAKSCGLLCAGQFLPPASQQTFQCACGGSISGNSMSFRGCTELFCPSHSAVNALLSTAGFGCYVLLLRMGHLQTQPTYSLTKKAQACLLSPRAIAGHHFSTVG